MATADKGKALNRAHRRCFLLNGLLLCGIRGSDYTIVGKDCYGCASRGGKGTYDNASYQISMNRTHA